MDFVDASAVFIDATYIKANANNKNYVNELVKLEAKNYQKELTDEINNDRDKQGKKPLKDNKNEDDDSTVGKPPAGIKNAKKSTADPECVFFIRENAKWNLHIQPETNTISFLEQMWLRAISMTV